MNQFKSIRIYLFIALLGLGYYAYAAWYGVAYWQSSVIKDTNDNGANHVRGAHVFYHK